MMPRSEPDRERIKATRIAAAKAKVIEFLDLNLNLAEQAELIDDLRARLHNDLRRKQWHKGRHREARP
jgi:hypothetical protein